MRFLRAGCPSRGWAEPHCLTGGCGLLVSRTQQSSNGHMIQRRLPEGEREEGGGKRGEGGREGRGGRGKRGEGEREEGGGKRGEGRGGRGKRGEGEREEGGGKRGEGRGGREEGGGGEGRGKREEHTHTSCSESKVGGLWVWLTRVPLRRG